MTRSARPVTPWARYRTIVQAVVLLWVIALGIRYLVVAEATSPEAYCPFGAVATVGSLLRGDGFLRQIALTNVLALGVVVVSGALLGRLFCGWVCPIGTLSDWLAIASRKLFGRQGPYPLSVPKAIDRPLRWLKLVVLGWILWSSVSAVVPPLAPFCPYRTIFEFSWVNLLSWSVLATFALLSLMIERFWCRYLCPLGMILAPLNWISPVRPRVDESKCISCGRCQRACPAAIDPVTDGTDHAECVRCYACVQACGKIGATTFHRPVDDTETRQD